MYLLKEGGVFFTCIVVSMAMEIIALSKDFQVLGIAQLGTASKIKGNQYISNLIGLQTVIESSN